jgi:hypothetical protein
MVLYTSNECSDFTVLEQGGGEAARGEKRNIFLSKINSLTKAYILAYMIGSIASILYRSLAECYSYMEF